MRPTPPAPPAAGWEVEVLFENPYDLCLDAQEGPMAARELILSSEQMKLFLKCANLDSRPLCASCIPNPLMQVSH